MLLIWQGLGIAAVAGSLLAALAFYLSGKPLLSLTSWQTDSSAGGFLALAGFDLHWPLLPLCAAGLLGVLAVAWPERRPPKLQS